MSNIKCLATVVIFSKRDFEVLSSELNVYIKKIPAGKQYRLHYSTATYALSDAYGAGEIVYSCMVEIIN